MQSEANLDLLSIINIENILTSKKTTHQRKELVIDILSIIYSLEEPAANFKATIMIRHLLEYLISSPSETNKRTETALISYLKTTSIFKLKLFGFVLIIDFITSIYHE